VRLPSGHPWTAHDTADSLLIRAMSGRPVDRPPVWFMRQAGRSLPEYRRVREGIPMLDACLDPALSAEITLQPVRRHGVDAAIFFSDIVVPLKAAGVGVVIEPGVGPVIDEPVRGRRDLARLPSPSHDMFEAVSAGVARAVAELGATPLIGFAGAPFTVASYLIEGGPSRDLARTKAMMLADPDLFSDVLARLAALSAAFLTAQVQAGASAVQLFDSWVGALPRRLYTRHVLPHTRRVFDEVAGFGVPRVHFAVGANHLAAEMAGAGCDVYGVDFRVDLDEVDPAVRGAMPLQGNLDPSVLLADRGTMQEEVRRVLDSGRGLRGHVFNLGHGVLPDTDAGMVTAAVEAVHRFGRPTERGQS
jgi:uroporphyrinogen decarboxylase